MKYVLVIYNAKNEFQGFVCLPRRTQKNVRFVTQRLDRAHQFSSKVKAYDRAGRYNAMNVERGLEAQVVPFDKGAGSATQEDARNGMDR